MSDEAKPEDSGALRETYRGFEGLQQYENLRVASSLVDGRPSFKRGELVVIKDYTFRFVREEGGTLVFEPHGSVLLGG